MGRHVGDLDPNTQSRDWQITIPRAPAGQVNQDGEPIDYSPEQIVSAFQIMGWSYWIFSEEVSESGLDHYQAFVQNNDRPIKLKDVRRKFKSAGIVNQWGESYADLLPRWHATVQSRIDYCSKSDTHKAGPWTDGEPRMYESKGKRSDLKVLAAAVDEGLTFDDLMTDPNYMYLMSGQRGKWVRDYIDSSQRKKAKELRKSHKWPDVHGYYIWGDSGVGKTTWVMEHFDDLYVGSGDKHPFDYYDGEDVILIDEFHFGGAFSGETLLRICDKFRVPIDARYHNVSPQWTRVIMTSNIPPAEQFRYFDDYQRAALSRRVSEWHFEEDDRGASVDRLDALLPLPITQSVGI